MTPRPLILIVDDDAQLTHVLQLRLESAGCAVVLARAANEALRVAQAECPDLIITDLHLIDERGFEFHRLLNERLASPPPVIYLTGGASTEDQCEALSLGASAFVTKPFDFAELLRQVQQCLRIGRGRMQERTLA
ncbi:Transcriptional regulatory protein PhoP [Phycisphaerae bacterium RAS1]|nr:Transcriptional regulatory protein PhoP [Phycisphaerae bacterium RAS1]